MKQTNHLALAPSHRPDDFLLLNNRLSEVAKTVEFPKHVDKERTDSIQEELAHTFFFSAFQTPRRSVDQGELIEEAFHQAQAFFKQYCAQNNLPTPLAEIALYTYKSESQGHKGFATASLREIVINEAPLARESWRWGHFVGLIVHELAHANAKVRAGVYNSGIAKLTQVGWKLREMSYPLKNNWALGGIMEEFAAASVERIFLTQEVGLAEHRSEVSQDCSISNSPRAKKEIRLFEIVAQLQGEKLYVDAIQLRNGKVVEGSTLTVYKPFTIVDSPKHPETQARISTGYNTLVALLDDLAGEIFPSVSKEEARFIFRNKAIQAQQTGDLSPLLREIKCKLGSDSMKFLLRLDSSDFIENQGFDELALTAFVKAGKLSGQEQLRIRKEIIELHQELRETAIDKNVLMTFWNKFSMNGIKRMLAEVRYKWNQKLRSLFD